MGVFENGWMEMRMGDGGDGDGWILKISFGLIYAQFEAVELFFLIPKRS